MKHVKIRGFKCERPLRLQIENGTPGVIHWSPTHNGHASDKSTYLISWQLITYVYGTTRRRSFLILVNYRQYGTEGFKGGGKFLEPYSG